MKDRLKTIGTWEIKTVNKLTGEILQIETVKNIIVNSGLERMARMCIGDNTTYFRAIAVGTDATGAQATDTELGTEVARSVSATLSYEASYKAKLTYTFSFGGSYSIVEAGCFDSETVSGSVMLNRATFSAKSVSTVIDLIATVTITFADA